MEKIELFRAVAEKAAEVMGMFPEELNASVFAYPDRVSLYLEAYNKVESIFMPLYDKNVDKALSKVTERVAEFVKCSKGLNLETMNEKCDSLRAQLDELEQKLDEMKGGEK